MRPAFLYIFLTMYWPLIGGFIGFLIILLLIGWAIDRSEQRAAARGVSEGERAQPPH